MAESNPTQVILTDDGLKIIKAQNTADNAAGGVANLNDPNLMSVIEKQTQAAQYTGLTSQYNVILKRAKDANVSTTALTMAYTNLNAFMATILMDTTKASNVDRNTYKSLTNAYNMALSNVQTALNNNFNTDISNMKSSVSVASQAASSAAVVASQAIATGNEASQTAAQAASAAKVAQSTGNDAISIAKSASQAASNAILAGSQATVSANKASADYQTLSAGVKDGSVVHITTKTVIDKGIIGTAEIANGAITNAQIGNAAVGTAQIANLAVGTAQIGNGAITNAKIGNLAVGTAQIANAAITDEKVGNVSANKITAGTIDFNTITGKNINASNITTGTLSTNRLNVGKLSALSANLGDVTTGSLKGVDIIANSFSTPNGSFTTDSNGAITAKNMTLISGTLTSPTINASTINGSTINGTTFNAGARLNSYGNTSHPLTISPDGSLNSTMFKTIATETAALRASLKDGMFRTNLRGMTPLVANEYPAADTALGAGQLALHEGYSTSQDANFTNNSLKSTGYVIVDASNGMTLHGDNQQITFNGTSADVIPKGIIITPYGNINPNGTQNIWYVGNGPTMKTASFGIDGSGANNIQFNRSLDIGNFNINTYHTITSSDNGPIHFNRANGKSVDIYASTVHYDSLVKSSLLSVKKDVRKVDTAYWAQLVNSIDLATYQYKTDDNTSHIRLSSIVDDVNDTKQWQLPDVFISRDADGKLNGVDDSVLLNATLATVQEQQKEIDQLNGHNMELEARLNKLEAKLNG
ncbi:phage tail protein [Pediococcus acidilactici]|uniref:phage tail protein n=1 Tax=Pediococcus acidilactici TaxID=1254 RepID=UPI00132A62D6|nr:phage tail protein [Pediococcus acidilactici]KAF0375290.1 phage tail protein [Pediococcus acidilactici]KAF0406681.1 phage tail protein [Pediococcus acidilactici]KAF0418155.1 phage tail protein [Pediococcus acidilactici]KAF0455438.1 phage tail protein [Pediococcus acidilactici]KAF0486508.1 phage tail protein [Pediococcus acidilactici]